MRFHHRNLVAGAMTIFTLSAQATDGPFDAIAYRWTNDVKMSSEHNKTGKTNTFWVGRLYGQITPTGRFVFAAENGCKFEGIAAQFITSYRFEANVTGCNDKDLSRVYTGYLNPSGTNLLLQGDSSTILPGAYDMYRISATLVRY